MNPSSLIFSVAALIVVAVTGCMTPEVVLKDAETGRPLQGVKVSRSEIPPAWEPALATILNPANLFVVGGSSHRDLEASTTDGAGRATFSNATYRDRYSIFLTDENTIHATAFGKETTLVPPARQPGVVGWTATLTHDNSKLTNKLTQKVYPEKVRDVASGTLYTMYDSRMRTRLSPNEEKLEAGLLGFEVDLDTRLGKVYLSIHHVSEQGFESYAIGLELKPDDNRTEAYIIERMDRSLLVVISTIWPKRTTIVSVDPKLGVRLLHDPIRKPVFSGLDYVSQVVRISDREWVLVGTLRHESTQWPLAYTLSEVQPGHFHLEEFSGPKETLGWGRVGNNKTRETKREVIIQYELKPGECVSIIDGWMQLYSVNETEVVFRRGAGKSRLEESFLTFPSRESGEHSIGNQQTVRLLSVSQKPALVILEKRSPKGSGRVTRH